MISIEQLPDSRVVNLGKFPNQSAFFAEYPSFDADLVRFSLDTDEEGRGCVSASASRWYLADYLLAYQGHGKLTFASGEKNLSIKKQDNRWEEKKRMMIAAL